MEVGDRIRAIRMERGLTQKELQAGAKEAIEGRFYKKVLEQQKK